MTPSFQLDDRAFMASLRGLARLPGKAAAPVLRQQAGLLAVDCIRLTPPTGHVPLSESFNTQLQVGRKAVESDLRGLFRDPRNLAAIKNRQRDLIWVQAAMASGQVSKIQYLLKSLHITGQVVAAATLALHKGSVGANGRPLKGRFYWVCNQASVKSLTAILKKRVGVSKSGFAFAAAKFGAKAKIPNWITGHTVRGIAIDATAETDRPSVTIGNPLAMVQKFGPRLQIIQRALARRAQSMSRQLEASLRKGMK